MKNNIGSSNLAAVLQKRMKDINNYGSTVTLEFGRITASGGLKLDHFPTIIPNGGYSICKSLLQDDVTTDAAEGHKHTVQLQKANGLKSGSRVLVGWVGNVPVVIDQVTT